MNAPSCPSCGGAPASTRVTQDGAPWATCGRCGFNYPMSAPSGLGATPGGGLGVPGGGFGAPPEGGFGAPGGGFGAPIGGGLGVPPGFGAPAAVPRRARPGRFLWFLLGPLLTCLPMVFLFSPRACSSVDDSHGMALDALRTCPRAQALLGESIDAAWVGLHTGESSTGGGYGRAMWSFDVTGKNGRGSYSYRAEQDGGAWRLLSATLTMDGQVVQIPGGCGAATSPEAPGSPGLGSPGLGSPELGSPGLGSPGAGSTPPAVPSAGACDRMQSCCDAAGSEQVLQGLCSSVGLVRTTPTSESTCQQLFDSAGRLLGATGRPVPPACQAR